MPVTFLKRLEEKLVAEIGGLRASQRVRLGKALARMHKRVDRVSEGGIEFPISDFWRDMQKDVGIQFVILGSQRMCFGALYYAYEHFVLECTKLVSGRQRLMVQHHEKFGEVFEEAFGQATRAYCWDAADLDFARLIRNSIAHAGCKVTPHLEKYRNRLVIEGGEIQIMAPMTADLFKCLKVRALRLAKEASSRLHAGSAATNLP